ncbi:MAG: hypothetical protein R2742_14630 [Micropruina glycogenica]
MRTWWAAVAGFDELLTDAGGACLWVSSQTLADLPAGVRDLGSVPWSPRTPDGATHPRLTRPHR